ncbi:hypothetical protein J19TS2_51410 [Cohnella xylanilytica]|nr:hypothetical protein J19TS2_51410 [Cohnella xylanilytica]
MIFLEEDVHADRFNGSVARAAELRRVLLPAPPLFFGRQLSSRTETRARIGLGPKSGFKNGPQPFLAPDAPR